MFSCIGDSVSFDFEPCIPLKGTLLLLNLVGDGHSPLIMMFLLCWDSFS